MGVLLGEKGRLEGVELGLEGLFLVVALGQGLGQVAEGFLGVLDGGG